MSTILLNILAVLLALLVIIAFSIFCYGVFRTAVMIFVIHYSNMDWVEVFKQLDEDKKLLAENLLEKLVEKSYLLRHRTMRCLIKLQDTDIISADQAREIQTYLEKSAAEICVKDVRLGKEVVIILDTFVIQKPDKLSQEGRKVYSDWLDLMKEHKKFSRVVHYLLPVTLQRLSD